VAGRAGVLFLLASAGLLSIGAVSGYLQLFSSFLPYDDEGLFLVSNRLFLAGHRPYTELTWLYGPAQLAWVQLVHGVIGVPLSHEAVRFMTLLLWLALAALSGWLVYALTRSRPWSLVAALLCFLFVESIVNEPGHPQSLIALAVLAIPLAAGAGAGGSSGWRWLPIGALCACIALVKPNAGVYTLAAVGVAFLAQAPPGPASRWSPLAVGLAALLFPFLLMLPLLDKPHCARFATLAGLSTASAGVFALRTAAGSFAPGASLRGFLAGLIATGLLVLAYALALGPGPLDILSSLLRYAGQQAAFYHLFREYSTWQLALAGCSLVLAVASSLRAGPPSLRRLAIPAKAAFVAAGAYGIVVNDPAHAQAILGWAWPWCWTLLVRPDGAGMPPGRLLLALLAAWSPLLAYPIPGSQLYFGSLPLLLAVAVAAADLSRLAARRLQQRYPERRPLRGLDAVIAGSALVLASLLLFTQCLEASDRYRRHERLALPGTGPLRIEPQRAQTYRRLVVAADEYEVVFTTFRLNSLFLWSTAAIPAPGAISQFPLAHASAEEQQRLRAGLARAGRALLVDRNDLHAARSAGGSLSWIEAEYVRVGQVGPYRLLARRPEPAARREPE
jgi:hypothetical protein